MTDTRTSQRTYPRRAVTSAALAVSGSLISSCARSSRSSDHALTIAVQGYFYPTMRMVLEQYRRIRPELNIQLQQLPADDSKWTLRMVTARLGGELPDVMGNVDVMVNRLADAQITENLVPWLRRRGGLRADQFIDEFRQQYQPLRYPRQIHGLPVGADATVLFYNKTLFDRSGVKYPTSRWTWLDLYAASKRLTKVGQKQFYGMAMADPWQAIYNPLIHSYGGFTYDANRNVCGIGSPEAIKAWQFMLRPYLDGTYAPYSVADSGASAPTFEAGKLGMTISVRLQCVRNRDQLKDKWDVALMPRWRGTRPTGGGSYGLSIGRTSQRKELAWDFLTWFYSEHGGQDVIQRSYQIVPPTKPGLQGGVWRRLPPPPASAEPFATAARQAIIAPALPQRAQAVLADSVRKATQKVVLNGEPVGRSFRAAADEVNSALSL